jgi:hypothetical protein
MKHVKIAIFSITFMLLPRILEALHVGKVVAYGVGTLVAFTAYLIPSKDEAPFPLGKWVLVAVPSSLVMAVVFGRLWPQ